MMAFTPPRLQLLRRALLIAAIVLVVIGVWNPAWERQQPVYQLLLTVDITASMNVRDYESAGQPQSRMARTKTVLLEVLRRLPCGSRVGLATFTERRSLLLLETIEVCENYSPLSQAISLLDWRMSWAGDSHIARGVYSAIDLAAGLESDLIFVTDGHEAPPLPHSGRPVYDPSDTARQVRGLILGAGGHALSPIPKYDDSGNEVGFLDEDEVDQENRLGLPPAHIQEREGWHPRNAPFGGSRATGTEHLSSVKETYLKELAAATELSYVPLNQSTDVVARQSELRTQPHTRALPTRPYWLALAFAALVAYYLSATLQTRRAKEPMR